MSLSLLVLVFAGMVTALVVLVIVLILSRLQMRTDSDDEVLLSSRDSSNPYASSSVARQPRRQNMWLAASVAILALIFGISLLLGFVAFLFVGKPVPAPAPAEPAGPAKTVTAEDVPAEAADKNRPEVLERE